MSETTDSTYPALLQRGELLRDQRRFAEAEKYFQQAITARPDAAEGYFELAFCYCNWDGHAKKALATVDHAISLDPGVAGHFALRAWILGNLDRDREAVTVAEQALAIDPYQMLALNAQARAYCDLREWTDAEALARRALGIIPTNPTASHLLSLALRQQGRLAESEQIAASMLNQAPDEAMSQSNAGWSALQAGDHQRANAHFLEALRLDPTSDHARRGLLHSFNSRVFIYRPYFQFVSWLSRHKRGSRIFFLIIVWTVYRVICTTLRTQFGAEGEAWMIVVATFYFILFGFGRSFGNFFLLLDSFARHALTAKEKRWAVFVALAFLVPLTALLVLHDWPQAAVLIAVVAIFLWSVLLPRIQGALSRRQAHAADGTA